MGSALPLAYKVYPSQEGGKYDRRRTVKKNEDQNTAKKGMDSHL